MKEITCLESLDELINAAKEANIRSEIYHFKQVGKSTGIN